LGHALGRPFSCGRVDDVRAHPAAVLTSVVPGPTVRTLDLLPHVLPSTAVRLELREADKPARAGSLRSVAGELDQGVPPIAERSAPASERDPVAELARFLTLLAESEFSGYCPLYEQVASHFATDREMLELYADAAPRSGLVPILLFACVHY